MKKSMVALCLCYCLIFINLFWTIVAINAFDNNVPQNVNEFEKYFDSDVYAGFYYDDNRHIHVNLTDISLINKLNNKTDITYHPVNYTLQYLNKLHEKLIANIDELNIDAMGTNIQNNCVLIELKDMSEQHINEIKDFITNEYDVNAVKFVKMDNEIVFN